MFPVVATVPVSMFGDPDRNESLLILKFIYEGVKQHPSLLRKNVTYVIIMIVVG